MMCSVIFLHKHLFRNFSSRGLPDKNLFEPSDKLTARTLSVFKVKNKCGVVSTPVYALGIRKP